MRHTVEYLHHGLSAIRRRLGTQRAAELDRAARQCTLPSSGAAAIPEAHFSWLCPLLEEYYDPMYRLSAEQNRPHPSFAAPMETVADWLEIIRRLIIRHKLFTGYHFPVN